MMLPFNSPEAAAGTKSVPTRAEISEADTWDLSQLYPNIEAWQAELDQYKATFPKLVEFKGSLNKSAARLRECLEFDKSLDLMVEKLYHFAMLQNAEDGSNNDYLRRMGELQIVLSQAAESAAWLTPEIQAIDDELFTSFLAADELQPWKIRLEKIRRFKPHILSEAEERILALAGSPLEGVDEAFSQLTNVDMDFGSLADETGQEVELSHGAFSSFLNKRDAGVREKAFRQYYREFSDHKFTLAATLAHSVKGDVFKARARHFPSAREAALFPDHVPVDVYDNLIATVRKRSDSVSRYYALRKKALDLPELHFYDTYTPMVKSIDVHTSFDEAVEKILAALNPLGSEYVDTLSDGFANRWVDRYETKGKRSGAFSSHSYGQPPYILMNYKPDVLSDMYTLAHEAGHSMHSWYCMRHQEFQDYQYPIFLAEVASTFNEELLTHHLLETTDDPAMRATILNRQIDDIRATVIRQTMFAEFEKLIHEQEEAGEALTLDSFRATYRELLTAYHGPELVLDKELELECLRIPHFYSAFYVYKYATGLSAAVALSDKVLDEGSTARDRYLGFLKSGGSQYPLETLQAAGVDMAVPHPIEATLDLFERRVAELEQILD